LNALVHKSLSRNLICLAFIHNDADAIDQKKVKEEVEGGTLVIATKTAIIDWISEIEGSQ